ncbi:MAG: hypothetical protein RIT45_3056 [Pseudomonadota bacterium]
MRTWRNDGGKTIVWLGAALGLVVAVGCSDESSGDTSTAPSQYVDVHFEDAGVFLPPKPTVSLCNPCNATLQCNGSDDKDAHCVDYGDMGAFCGAGCTSDSDCTEGYRCGDVKSVEGEAVKQCVRKGEGAASFGECPCSAWAAAKALSTRCIAEFQINAAEKSFCAGARYCREDGLTECAATAPTTEKCDGFDNDCDGETDEDTCDDAPLCQVGSCHVALGCQYASAPGACNDGNACTDKDACKNGACTGGAIDCDDGDPCTLDGCDKGSGCTHSFASGAPCDDGEACTVGDACADGKCVAGGPKDCNDGNPCTKDVCHKASGDCINDSAITDPCDDGDACTEGDACKDGACVSGAAKSCDDGNKCTDDSCKSESGCVNLPNSVTPCD